MLEYVERPFPRRRRTIYTLRYRFALAVAFLVANVLGGALFFQRLGRRGVGLDRMIQDGLSPDIQWEKKCMGSEGPGQPPREAKSVVPLNRVGRLRIVIFTDCHFGMGGVTDAATLLMMNRILDWERPDLVVLLGDQLDHESRRRPEKALYTLFRPMEVRGIPYAVIHGNHDAESGISRLRLSHIAEQCRWSRGHHTPLIAPHEREARTSNFILSVPRAPTRGSTAAERHHRPGGKRRPRFTFAKTPDKLQEPWAQLVFFDSGPTMMGSVAPSQLKWYEENASQSVPTVIFVHSALEELQSAWMRGSCTGHMYEKGEGQQHRTLFPALGDNVLAVVSGHDHKNDYCCMVDGVLLCYARNSGYKGYGNAALLDRGSRVLELHAGGPRDGDNALNVSSWIRLADGTVIFPHHQQRDPIPYYMGIPHPFNWMRKWIDIIYGHLMGNDEVELE